MSTVGLNLLSSLHQMAIQRPNEFAFMFPKSALTFAQLEEKSNEKAEALLKAGVRFGDRAVVLIPPGPDFFLVAFGLLKIGAVMVLVDPGIGWSNLRQCLDEAEPRVFIGVWRAHLGRIIFGWARQTLQIHLGVSCGSWRNHKVTNFSPTPASAKMPAAIVFTSGSTGVPKGVIYTHELFAAQMSLVNESLGAAQGGVNIATFAPFAFLAPGIGLTSVLPKMNFRKPGKINARRLFELIRKSKASSLFGSPALLRRLADFAEKEKTQIPFLRKVFSAGAPVPFRLLKSLTQSLSADAEIYTPYGATEALPLTNISAQEILQETSHGTAKGLGVCVGKPFKGVTLEIMKISDDHFTAWSDDLREVPSSIGEIVVWGKNISSSYYGRESANSLHKIRRGEEIGHRTGDVGYKDSEGRVWFCGRKNHIVWTEAGPLFSVSCEGIFDEEPSVLRTALVGVGPRGKQKPVLCVELRSEERHRIDLPKLKATLREKALSRPLTRSIDVFLFHPGFPVDIRHNAKIFREKLSVWASNQISKEL